MGTGTGMGRAAPALRQTGTHGHSEGTQGRGRETQDTGFLPGLTTCVGPQPHTPPHRGGEQSGEGGITQDTCWEYWEPCPPRVSLAWGFAPSARAGCGQRPGSGTSRGQPLRAHSPAPPSPAHPPSLAGTPSPQAQLSPGWGDDTHPQKHPAPLSPALGVTHTHPPQRRILAGGWGGWGCSLCQFLVSTMGTLRCPHCWGVPVMAGGGWEPQGGGERVAVLGGV